MWVYAASFHVEKHLLFLAFSGYTSLAVLNPLWNILDTFLFQHLSVGKEAPPHLSFFPRAFFKF